MTLDASFCELDPNYSRGVYGSSLQGESHSEENKDGGKELFELEENGGSFEGYLPSSVVPNILGCGASPELCTDQRIPNNDPHSFPEFPKLPTPTH